MRSDMPIVDLYARRRRAEDAWGLTDEVVLIFSGKPMPIPGAFDQTYEFRVHPEYRWLTDRDRAGFVLAFDPLEGWTEFVPEVSEMERLFDGASQAAGKPRAELASWLQSLNERSVAVLGAPDQKVKHSIELSDKLSRSLAPLRRKKDEVELARIAAAVNATAAGFRVAAELLAPGVTERFMQIEIERAMSHAGGERMAYSPIVAAGANSAVFHARPGAKKFRADEFVLIDMGAEIGGYCADVTRTFSVSGVMSPPKRALYDAVLSTQVRAIDLCRSGAEWSDIHRNTAIMLSEALVELGLCAVSAEEFTESEAISLFFPHGVGHAVGMGVRDAGFLHPMRPGGAKAAGVNVRVDLALEPGFTMTVEPGLYFIPSLLNDVGKREMFRTQVRWENIDQWLSVGGVRIEDNILVTEDVPQVLTRNIPK